MDCDRHKNDPTEPPHALIPRTCECVSVRGRGKLGLQMELSLQSVDLQIGTRPALPEQAQSNHNGPLQKKKRRKMKAAEVPNQMKLLSCYKAGFDDGGRGS